MNRLGVGLAVALAFGLLPETALACGGFFCSTAPVTQSRERIVYALEADGTLTMAVQVNYVGRDEDFAWILPVPVPPDTITLGTDELFDALDAATNPSFATENIVEGECQATPMCSYPSYGGGGCAFGCGSYSAPDYYYDASAGYDAGSVTVYAESIVGPYDTVTLGASTAAEVIDWLNTNGYDVPASSAPLLDPYAAQGHVFIALRLTANRETDTLRPIVVNMPAAEACLPIRLTAIATAPELPIAAFFLGSARVNSTNYSTAEVPLVPELWQGTLSWDAAVAARVRELGGQAFATDSAGATPSISIELPSVADLATFTDPHQLLSELQSRGYTGSALLLELLQRYLVPPVGRTAQTYYNCLAFDSTGYCGLPSSFDAAGLADGIETNITIPLRDAQAMVERHPYLTRLSTTLAAEDMTIDPVFAIDAGLPDVSSVRTAQLHTLCTRDYFEEYAPQAIEIDGVRHPFREGRMMDADEYCGRYGGTPSAPSGGGGCASSRRGVPIPGALFFAAIVVLFAYRTLRRRR